MTDQSDLIQKLVDNIEVPAAPNKGFDTVRLFAEAATAKKLGAFASACIDPICELVTHGKRVSRAYDDKMKSVRGAGTPTAAEWAVMVACLLRWSEIPDRCDDGQRGDAFSRLNAALMAIDHVNETGEMPESEALKVWGRGNSERIAASLVVKL